MPSMRGKIEITYYICFVLECNGCFYLLVICKTSLHECKVTINNFDVFSFFFFSEPFNPLNPEKDQHLISPNSNMAESFVKIMRIKEMIIIQRSFDCKTNSPHQY